MKKHFLILMLMALLPLAGFADTFDVSKFSSKNFSYGAAEFPANFITSTYAQVEDEDVWEADLTQFYGSTANTTDGTVDESLVYDAENLATTPAGKYWIKITGKENSQFEGQEVYKDFWINPGKIFITFDKNDASMSKTYGEDDPEEFAFTAVVNEAEVEEDALEALMLVIGRVAGTDAGKYKFTAVSNNDNYTAYIEKWGEGEEAEDPYFTIDQKEITATVTLGDEVLTYTGSDQAPTITVLDEEENEIPSAEFTFTYKYSATAEGEFGDAAADHANAGYYKVVATPVEEGNYTLAGEAVNATSETAFQIKQKALNIYVNNLTKVYDGTTDIYGTPENEDDPNIAPTIAYSGLVGEDATEAKPFGVNAFGAAYVTILDDNGNKNVTTTGYALKAVAAVGEDAPTGNYANYDVNFLNTGKLFVTKKAITVKPAEDLQKEIDSEDAFDAADIVVTGAVDEEGATIASAYKIVRSNDDEAVGTYEDVLSVALKTAEELAAEELDAAVITATLANYEIDATGTADFEITGGTLYVYPKSVAIVYGDPTPTTFDVVATTAAGTEVEIEKPNVIFKDLDAAPTAAGTYVLTLDGDVTVDGYNVVPLDGQYTISKKTLNITVQSQILQAGDAEALLDQTKIDYNGTKVGDDVIGIALKFNVAAGEGTLNGQVDEDETTHALSLKNTIANNTTFANGIKIVKVEGTEEAPNANDNYNIDLTITGELTVGGMFFLSLESNEEDWDEIVKYDGEQADVNWAPNRNQPLAKFDGDWKANEWNTGILPFAVTPRELSNAFGYAIVNVADPDKTTDENVAFKLNMTDVIPANTPFAIKTDVAVPDLETLPVWEGDGDPSEEFNAEFAIAWDAIYASFGKEGGFTIEKPESKIVEVEVSHGHKFVGVYEEVTMDNTKSNCHFMVNGAWKHLGATSTREFTILPLNCYIESPAAAAARGITFTFEELDGTTTAIKAIEADSNDFESAKTGIYTIGGMKLQGAPTQKGVYIKDGKKIVIK